MGACDIVFEDFLGPPRINPLARPAQADVVEV
jgi:hypothetical protein